MKIAFFTDTYYPAVDGVVRSIESYKKGLEAQGHEVRVFAPSPKDAGKKVSWAKYCKSVEFPPYKQYRIPIDLTPCVKDALEFKPDIIHSHAMALMGLGAKKAALKANVPLVGTFHTMIPQAGHYISEVEGVQLWFENISWKYLQWFYKDGFSKILCPSKYVQQKLSKYDIHGEVLPNPVDVRKFRSVKKESGPLFQKNTILFLGRVAKEKNIDFLLDIARLEEFESLGAQILIAGDGPYKKNLEKKVEKDKLEQRVKFAGRVDEKNLNEFYSQSACALFPSLFETQGLTALESLACSTPVIAIEDTAICEFITDGKNGYVINRNPKEAIGALAKAIKNKNKMKKFARQTAMKYSIEKCSTQLIKTYKSCL